MDIRIRIANLPGSAEPAAPPSPPALAAAAAVPLTQPSSAEPPAAPRPEMHSSLVAAIGRLQIRINAGPAAAGALTPTVGRLTPQSAALQPPTPRPVLILGSIPLAKSKSKKRTTPADQQVIPLVLPDFIDPEEVRGRVRMHAQEFEAHPPVEEPQEEPPVAPRPEPAVADAAPVVSDVPAVESAAGESVAESIATEAVAAPMEPAVAPPTPKVLVRPGPDPIALKKADGDAAPEESPAERIARIQREDEEMRTDERRVLKFASDVGKLSSMVEVILFQNAKPLTINQIARALPGKVNPKQLRQSLRLCADRFDRGEHPIELVEIAGGWQLVVRSGFQELIESFAGGTKKRTITGSIMETLAIIAYRQGTTKVEIETLRGINDCSPHLRQLIEMGLAASGRRTDLPGSPMGYWTTPLFMRAVGIRSLDELGQMGEFTPTEVAGLVEMELPADGAAESDAEGGAAETESAAEEEGAEPAIDADAIDAAMKSGETETEAEPEPANGDLFGEAVVIPVDPADTRIALTQSSSQPPSAGSSAPTGKAKRTRKRDAGES